MRKYFLFVYYRLAYNGLDWLLLRRDNNKLNKMVILSVFLEDLSYNSVIDTRFIQTMTGISPPKLHTSPASFIRFRNYTFGTLVEDEEPGEGGHGISDAALDEFQQLLAVLRNFNR